MNCTLQFFSEYFSIIVITLFLEFVLVAFISYKWFGVDNLIDSNETKDHDLDHLHLTMADMNVHIDILEKFFVEEITHMCVVDKNDNIKFFCDAKDSECIEKCEEMISSLSRHSMTNKNIYLIKPMILFNKINEIEYLLRSKEIKEKGALQNARTEDRFE